MRRMYRRLAMLAVAGLLATGCFGKFALGVTQTVEPTAILPGASVKQELNIEADGLLGSAVKQAMTDAAMKEALPQSGTQWQIRDNSEGTAVRLRMFRTVSLTEAQAEVPETSTGGFDVGTMTVRADDWLVARRYAVRVLVSSKAPTSPTGAPTGTDYYVSLPGFVTATNGAPGDGSRLVWHLDPSSASERILTAESIYPDVPRLVLLLVIIVLIGIGTIVLRSRRSRRTVVESPGPGTPFGP
jgi:hypothetical protein